MGGIWAFIESASGAISMSNIALAQAAKSLAGQSESESACVYFAKEPESALFQLRDLGPTRIIWARDARLDIFRPAAFARTLAAVARERQPDVILFASTLFSKEVAARTAQALGTGLIADVASWKVEIGKTIFGKVNFGGKFAVSVETTKSPTMVIFTGSLANLPPPPPQTALADSIEVKVPEVDLW
ncbi:MAG: hypothetical protein ACREJQ_06535, partial [bacterium]